MILRKVLMKKHDSVDDLMDVYYWHNADDFLTWRLYCMSYDIVDITDQMIKIEIYERL